MRYKTIAPIVLILLLITTTGSRAAEQTATADQQKITHILNRLGFGPRPGDVERVQKMGIKEYIEQQLHPESIPDTRADDRAFHLASIRMSQEQIFQNYPDPQQLARQLGLRGGNQPNQQNPQTPAARPNLQSRLNRGNAAQNPANATDPAMQAGTPQANGAANQALDPAARQKLNQYMQSNNLGRPQELLQELVSNKIIRAVESDRQLQEVMTDFWFNHFNIYWQKGQDKWLVTDYETNVIRPNALGKFKDLLMATAKSPAMLFYLDNHLSSAPAPAIQARLQARQNANAPARRKQDINENYARELMELHTLGVDGGYTQKDVTEVARAFTGWTIDRPQDRLQKPPPLGVSKQEQQKLAARI